MTMTASAVSRNRCDGVRGHVRQGRLFFCALDETRLRAALLDFEHNAPPLRPPDWLANLATLLGRPVIPGIRGWKRQGNWVGTAVL